MCEKLVFFDELRIIIDINLLYCNVYNVCCKNDEEIWIFGDDNFIEFYNFQGNRVRLIVYMFGFMFRDIVVGCSGDLFFVIERNKCVNIVDRKNRYKVFREYGQIFFSISIIGCCNFLVVMIKDEDKDENKENKVVCYVKFREE